MFKLPPQIGAPRCFVMVTTPFCPAKAVRPSDSWGGAIVTMGDFARDGSGRRLCMGESMSSDEGDGKKRAVSRRVLLQAGGCALGAACLAAIAQAQEGEADPSPHKTSQKDAGYKPQPTDGRKCLICANFQAPESCQLVEGTISSNGSCKLFVMSWATHL